MTIGNGDTATDSDQGLIELKLEFNKTANGGLTLYYGLSSEEYSNLQRQIRKDATANDVHKWLRANNVKRHRTDGPAIVGIYEYGVSTKKWYSEDRLHRTDGPAVVEISADGSSFEQWYSEGKLHRTDGPALVNTRVDGESIETWYSEGKRHRTDGPARVHTHANGSSHEAWYSKGRLHRTDGPAIVDTYANGISCETWYRKGEFIKKEELVNPEIIPGVTIKPHQP